MKIFMRNRAWLLLLPLLLLSFGLWNVREQRSWVPRATPIYSGMLLSSNTTQLPILWRADGVWVLRPDASHQARERAINWNNTPVALHYPFHLSDVALTVRAESQEILRSHDDKIELWRDGKRVVTVKEPQRHNSNGEMNASPPSLLAISPDGTRWATASQLNGLFSSSETSDDLASDGVTLWGAREKRDIARLNAKLGNVTALAFSPDSRTLAAVGSDGFAFLWNANDGKLIRQWRAHPWVAATLAWSPDGQTLLTGANPRLGQAGGWKISIANGLSISSSDASAMTGRIKAKARDFRVKVDAQGALTINGQTDRSLRLWNVKSGVMLRKWESATGVCSAQFSPDGREIAVGTHGEALLFESATLKLVRRLPMKDYARWPMSVAWSPDGATVAVACAPQLTFWRAH